MSYDRSQEISDLDEAAKLKSVSSGGESASYDTNAAKAKRRNAVNEDQGRQAAGRVRPYFGRIRFRGLY